MSLPRHLASFAILLAVLIVIAAVVQWRVTPTTQPVKSDVPQWELPAYLREASGLAVLNDTQLLTHNDEKGVIYLVTLDARKIDKLVTLGEKKKGIRDDFEGIAINGSDVYLVTSRGTIYQIKNLSPLPLEQIIQPDVIETGLEDFCEFEGLAIEDDRLLLPCKMPLIEQYENKLVVLYYSITDGSTGVHLSIPIEDLRGLKRVHPTAIEVTETDYYIISGHRLIVIARQSLAVNLYGLRKKLHFQPEGIAIWRDDSIVIVDDVRKGISRLTHYSGLSQLKPKNK